VLRRWWIRWRYLAVRLAALLALAFFLRFQAGWTWDSTATAVILVFFAYQFVVVVIDERIARSTWPHASAFQTEDLPPPHVAVPRIWTFYFRFSVPWIVRVVSQRGFPYSRQTLEIVGKLAHRLDQDRRVRLQGADTPMDGGSG